MASRPRGFDEVNNIGTVFFNGCVPVEPTGFEITVSEAWDDWTPRRVIIATVSAGITAAEFNMDVDKAEALGLLLLSAAKGMRKMAEHLDQKESEEEE